MTCVVLVLGCEGTFGAVGFANHSMLAVARVLPMFVWRQQEGAERVHPHRQLVEGYVGFQA